MGGWIQKNTTGGRAAIGRLSVNNSGLYGSGNIIQKIQIPPVINDQTFNVTLTPGAELLTNGTFDTDLTGWDDENSAWAVVSGRAYHALSSVFNQLKHTLTYDGYVWRVSFDYDVITSAVRLDYRTATDNFIDFIINDLSGQGTYAENHIPHQNTGIVSFARSHSGVAMEGYVDNVSIKQVCPVVIGTVQATDEDPFTYSIIAGNTDNDLTIDTNTGVLSWANAPDANRTATYNLTVRVDNGTSTDEASVVVNVT